MNKTINKIYSIKEIKDTIKPILDKSPVIYAILFGSYASGTATSKSDIDLLINSEGKLRGFDFYEILESLVQKTKKDIDLIEKQEIEKGTFIDNEITSTGIVVYEKS